MARNSKLEACPLTPSPVLPSTPLSLHAHIEVYFLIAVTKFPQQQSCLIRLLIGAQQPGG